MKENYKYLLLTESEGRTVSYGPSFFPMDLWPKVKCAGHKSLEENVIYKTDWQDEISKIFFLISTTCLARW